ncbi:MAG: hypothetical protein F6K37_41465, partial [Moorea sp. SIO4E2]|uniref:hypothetical protein n=1 Tax=Moorena sp. SIO4E2 TaxID=2607826 RepID=UPI0013BBFE85
SGQLSAVSSEQIKKMITCFLDAKREWGKPPQVGAASLVQKHLMSTLGIGMQKPVNVLDLSAPFELVEPQAQFQSLLYGFASD